MKCELFFRVTNLSVITYKQLKFFRRKLIFWKALNNPTVKFAVVMTISNTDKSRKVFTKIGPIKEWKFFTRNLLLSTKIPHSLYSVFLLVPKFIRDTLEIRNRKFPWI